MSEFRSFRAGVDWGQRIDHSAVCLVEEKQGKLVVKLLVKYDLMTPYPLIVRTLMQMYDSVSRVGQFVSFASDATGIGRAPTDMLQQRLPDVRIEPYVFNNQNKREMIGKLKVLHSFGRLKFAKRQGDKLYNETLIELKQELKALQAKVIREDLKNPEIEVFRTGKHDDLVSALGLAIKDVEIRDEWDDSFFVIEDRSWVRTPLDNQSVPIAFEPMPG